MKKLSTFRTSWWIFLLIFLISYLFLFSFSAQKTQENSDELLINDVSRLNPTKVQKIVKGKELESFQEALKEARDKNLKVSIAGRRHSMGGHTFYKDGVVLDMTGYNKILAIDTDTKTITVQSGATWSDVIKELNAVDLSIPVLQDYSSFSVGGSMSVNIHQSDPTYGPIIETIQSFRLLQADGTVIHVSRDENPELFGLVIGGYGLFGVILDVDIDLTENDYYVKNEELIRYDDYEDYYETLRVNPEIENVFARLSIVPDDTLLRDVIVTTYKISPEKDPELHPIKEDNLALKKLFIGISRKYAWGKKFRWYMQSRYSNLVEPPVITRNNLDYNDASFLDYYSSRDTDILQEYFFPKSELTHFIDTLRTVVKDNNLNLLSATIRYVPENDESYLSYSDKGSDLFAVVLYFNVGLSDAEQEKVQKWTQELIDYSISINGTYYLPYQLYASQEQIRAAYPQFDTFVELKKKYDPQEIFMNDFYAKYALQEDL